MPPKNFLLRPIEVAEETFQTRELKQLTLRLPKVLFLDNYVS
jgi:hypothetical protein